MGTTRRKYLVAAGGAATLGLAGCLSGAGTDTDGGGPGTGGDEQQNRVQKLPTPTKGSDDAPVTVQVFKDFSCPHCATFELEAVPKLESEFVEPGDVLYEHRDFPLPVDKQWSWAAPNAARAVQETVGEDAFFEYAVTLFENQSRYSMDLLANLASDVGADGAKVRSAAENGTYQPVLETDRTLAREQGASGTPAVFVDGEQVELANTIDEYYQNVRAAIRSKL
ncbi:DsbA family protein [Halegenticoccus soli]|uniref:DsbA family protein n=1 Tax=Halegenticoccus soli TaxID=1985678 RepID=UPI000C6C8E27|nr:thioredoxin domain-containing protein [Halegenticoccus soli]